MSLPESPALSPRESPPGAPVFAEAWQAEVLGIAHALTRGGLFSDAEWAAALGAALRAAEARGAPDNDATYYAAVLAALEGLVAAKSPATAGALGQRTDAWRRAYLNTPHGKPVELAAADHAPLHDRAHDDHEDGDHHHDH